MIHNRMSVEVAPGETAEGYLEFSGMELEDAGISEIADFEFQLYLWNASRSDMGPEGTETPVIQLRTSAAEGFSYSFDDSGEEVYHLNWIRIVSQGVSAVNNDNPALKFFIENRWKKAIWVRAQEVSVKGYKVDSDSLENRMIAPGKRAIYYVPLKENFLMKSSAGKIESAQLSFHIFKWILFPDQSDTPLINLEY